MTEAEAQTNEVPEMQSYLLSFEALRQRVIARNEHLPERLARVARYVLDRPDTVALGSVSVAVQAQVAPSTLVRFAQLLGFDDFLVAARALSQANCVFVLSGRDALRLPVFSMLPSQASNEGLFSLRIVPAT